MVLHAVLITYRRPSAAEIYIERLLEQTVVPETLVMVDNSPDPRNEAALERFESAGHRTVYLPRDDNPGPAGGFRAALEVIMPNASDDDWVVLLDDDDPPFSTDLVAAVLDLGTRSVSDRPDVGAVGLTGVCWDRRAGRLRRYADDDLRGTLPVDMIGGNQLPMYRVGALRRAGLPDGALFWGYEELEQGLRLRRAGFELLVDGSLVHRCRAHFDRLGDGVAKSSISRVKSPWRTYYSLRNLVAVLVRNHLMWSAGLVSVRAAGTAGFALLTRRPGSAAIFRCTGRALLDGWTGRLGRSWVGDEGD